MRFVTPSLFSVFVENVDSISACPLLKGTILLARIFLKERVAKSQLLGIVLALVGVALIAAG